MRQTPPMHPPVHAERQFGGASPGVVRGMWAGQHLIAAALIVAGIVRALVEGTDPAAAIAAGAAVGVCYGIGAVFATAGSRDARRARWWLLGLTLVWVAAVVVSAEFVWIAFLLWLLAGHLLPGWWSILYAAAVYARRHRRPDPAPRHHRVGERFRAADRRGVRTRGLPRLPASVARRRRTRPPARVPGAGRSGRPPICRTSSH